MSVEESPNIDQLIFFEITGKGNSFKTFNGKKGDKGYYYPKIDINLFSTEQVKIPKNAKMRKLPSEEWARKYLSDPDRTHVVPLKEKPVGYKNAKMYYTHDNGGNPFLVYITKNKVVVYSEYNPLYYIWESDWKNMKDGEMWPYYTNRVIEFENPIKVWIGESDPVENYHPKGNWSLGNSILIQLSPQKYYFIGDSIFSFTSRSPIIRYESPVGNNDVPYPIAFTENRLFFMPDEISYIIPEDYNEKTPIEITMDYYSRDEKLNDVKKMTNLKVIQKRR